jgi:hypothetical protein
VNGRDNAITTQEIAELFADAKEIKTYRVCPNWSDDKGILRSSGSLEPIKRKTKKSSKSRAMLSRLHSNLVHFAFFSLII